MSIIVSGAPEGDRAVFVWGHLSVMAESFQESASTITWLLWMRSVVLVLAYLDAGLDYLTELGVFGS